MRISEHRETKPALTLAVVIVGALIFVGIGFREYSSRQPAPGTIGSQDSCRCCPRCGCPGEDNFCKKTPAQFVAQ